MRSQDIGVLARFQLVALENRLIQCSTRCWRRRGIGRRARLAAIQVAVLKAIEDKGLKKVISFHNRIDDAEVFASTLPRRIEAEDDLRAAFPNGVWARWLSGEHTGRHRKQVLAEFDDEEPGGLQRPALLANSKVLAEGLDTKSDAVLFTSAKGSLVDLIQAIGRALRQQPGAGKVATIMVPTIVAKGRPRHDRRRHHPAATSSPTPASPHSSPSSKASAPTTAT
ncbi:helicase-related protein [Streptacidiphilus sp. PAMC 29251]